jgi:hypothetical protein
MIRIYTVSSSDDARIVILHPHEGLACPWLFSGVLLVAAGEFRLRKEQGRILSSVVLAMWANVTEEGACGGARSDIESHFPRAIVTLRSDK